jgi:hypothetical protein
MLSQKEQADNSNDEKGYEEGAGGGSRQPMALVGLDGALAILTWAPGPALRSYKSQGQGGVRAIEDTYTSGPFQGKIWDRGLTRQMSPTQ